jgi:N-acetyl-anhydromuramyl-L-alanine amidase AmpD
LDDGTWQQFVQYSHKAHHARGHNDVSVGYELQGPHTRNDWPGVVITKLAEVIGYFAEYYPIDKVRSHRSVTPLRKSDPGVNFPWGDLGSLLPGMQIVP